MYCARCGTQNAEGASFCGQCGASMSGGQSAPVAQAADELASMGNRVGAFLIDGILQAIPYLGFVIQIINWVKFRRGSTIGLGIVGARIVRENGDISGFFHTFVRAFASVLSFIPLGLGFWWAFWDPWRQTWHDKIMHTYVMRDTPELAQRDGTSSDRAKLWFWVLVVGLPVLGILAAIIFSA